MFVILYGVIFFFKQKTAYEIVSGDWSSDVCSSDLAKEGRRYRLPDRAASDRSRHGVGTAHGRPERVAAHLRRRQAGGLPHPRWWRQLAAHGSRVAAVAGLVHGVASGHVR